MLRLICTVLFFMLAFSAFASDQEEGSKGPASFESNFSQAMTPIENGIRLGGDTIESAIPIDMLPFSDSGNTVGYQNDYNDICVIGPNNAADVVYSFTPTSDMLLDIDLCESAFGNQLFVYEDEYVSGDPYACVPMFYYGVSECGFLAARMAGLPVYSGHTYFIIIDGYDGSQGTYTIEVQQMPACDVTFSSDAMPEGEPPLANDYVDTYNTGCNADPPILQNIDSFQPDTGCLNIAGISGYLRPAYSYFSRDTDWYSVIASGTEIKASIIAEAPFSLFVNAAGCPAYGSSSVHVDPCVSGEINYPTIPGNEYFIFVALQGVGHWNLELTSIEYELQVCGQDGMVQIESMTWDALKADYR